MWYSHRLVVIAYLQNHAELAATLRREPFRRVTSGISVEVVESGTMSSTMCLYKLYKLYISYGTRFRPPRSLPARSALLLLLSSTNPPKCRGETSRPNVKIPVEWPACYQATISADSAPQSCPIGKVPLPQRLPAPLQHDKNVPWYHQEIPT